MTAKITNPIPTRIANIFQIEASSFAPAHIAHAAARNVKAALESADTMFLGSSAMLVTTSHGLLLVEGEFGTG
jgi:hypothetical protein